jgi:hypothetical protein
MSAPRNIVEDFDEIRARQEELKLPVASDDDGEREAAAIAAIEFEPLAADDVKRLLAVLSEPHWGEKLPSYRVALALLGRSKDQLIAGVREGEDAVKAHIEFFEYLGVQQEWLCEIAKFIGSARARIDVALHAAMLADDDGGAA